MTADEAIEQFIFKSRLRRASKLVTDKLAVARKRGQKSIAIPLAEAEALLTALGSDR